MKRMIATISALSMLLALTACGESGNSTNDILSVTPAPAVTEAASAQSGSPASQTGNGASVYGQVTAIDGANVTVLLGEYSLPDMGNWEMPEDGQRLEGMPDGGPGNGQIPPDMPEGTIPQGGMPDGERPEMPEGGEAPWGDGEASERPDGEGGGFGGGRGQMTFFTAGTERVTYDLTNAEIMVQNGEGADYAALEDITVDSLLEISLNDAETVVSVRIMPSGGMGGFGEKPRS